MVTIQKSIRARSTNAPVRAFGSALLMSHENKDAHRRGVPENGDRECPVCGTGRQSKKWTGQIHKSYCSEKQMKIAFGDNVRILSSPETDKIGLSGKTGQVYGETTPSSTSVTVIGELIDDYAINVSVDDAGGEYWFSPNLLKFINHGKGTEITIGNRRAVRNADGSWEDFITSKKWWQFWR